MSTILDEYITTAPSAQHAIDLFKGEWSSILPAELGIESGGAAGLFDDPRIGWFMNQIGPVDGRSVLELGPLEAGHTATFERAGAGSVVAVEGNTRAYLKCLVVKELLGLKRSRFLLGDIVEHLKEDGPAYDIGIASGVLYHMRNPAELVQLLAGRCRTVFVWTHYWDADRVGRLAGHKQFGKLQPAEHAGFSYRAIRRSYDEALSWSGFCGGSADHANWLPRQDLLDCFDHFGLQVQGIEFDQPDHPNGPALALWATNRRHLP